MKMYRKIVIFLFILLIIPFSCFALDVEPSIASGEDDGTSQLTDSNNYKNEATNYQSFIDDKVDLVNENE